jgi:hypothetical protein
LIKIYPNIPSSIGLYICFPLLYMIMGLWSWENMGNYSPYHYRLQSPIIPLDNHRIIIIIPMGSILFLSIIFQ